MQCRWLVKIWRTRATHWAIDEKFRPIPCKRPGSTDFGLTKQKSLTLRLLLMTKLILWELIL